MRTEAYASGLVAELRGYEAVGLTDRAAEVRAELERIAPELPRAIAKAERDMKDPITLDTGVDVSILDNLTEVQQLRRTEAALEELGYLGGRRTAARAAAPNKAVPAPSR
jgi:hypothetical protein